MFEVFLDMPSTIAHGSVNAVVGMVEVKRVSLWVFSHLQSLGVGGYSWCWGQTDGICPDSFLSLVGSLLGGTLQFASGFALIFP